VQLDCACIYIIGKIAEVRSLHAQKLKELVVSMYRPFPIKKAKECCRPESSRPTIILDRNFERFLIAQIAGARQVRNLSGFCNEMGRDGQIGNSLHQRCRS
jgi:hypothetical protein